MFLGVDGGGSKTAFILMDSTGSVLARYKSSGSYYLQIGLERLSSVLREGIESVCKLANIKIQDIQYAFFGLPAYGEDSRVQEALNILPHKILGGVPYACGNDMVCGWAGSLGCLDGINIVSGTGSIGYGECGASSARAGGWGELFSDEGSAYWLAVQGFNAFSRMSDGRMSRGPLYDVYREAYELEADLDLSGIVMSEIAPTRDKVAAQAKLVALAAERGDATSIQIYQKAASELADIVITIANKLPFDPNIPIMVSYSGGVFAAGDVILKPLEASLNQASKQYILTPPLSEPDIGAAMYASKLCGVLINSSGN